MAASSWATFETSKALLKKHGSVDDLAAAAKEDPSVVAGLSTGLERWAEVDASVVAAASEVDIVIPVRSP
jgi:hypothetical protein